MTQQINNEYKFAKFHTVETIRDGMQDMEKYVLEYVKLLREYFSVTDFEYTLKDGTKKVWVTKQTRYEDMQNLSDTELTDLAWLTVVSCVMQKDSTFTAIVGKLRHKLPHTDRLALETAAEMLGVLNQTPFITVIYPRDADTGVMKIHSNLTLEPSLVTYLREQRFVLPSLVHPKEITCNTDTGYQTLSGSVILGGKHHERKVNLAHLNRQNAIGLCLDERVLTTVNPTFKEKDETLDERAKRHTAWKQLNLECIALYKLFVGKEFFLMHKFDERLRTYAHAHHFNTQGDDYRKGAIELADRELVRC